MYTGGGAEDVVCRCGRAMCFRCGDEAHKPASCAEVASWREREKDDSVTELWLSWNTKKCPKCPLRIDRGLGDNHMVCRCRHEFCFICLEPWAPGHRYGCSKRKPAVKSADDEAKEAELKVYLFYNERFHAQRDAVRAIHLLDAEVTAEWAKLLAVRRGDGATHDALTTTLRDAMEVVKRGRRVAGWAYVHAFYIPAASVAYRTLFEDSQTMLERHLENLHERCVPSALRRLTEGLTRDHGSGVAAVEEWRRAVAQYAGATDKFLGNLLRGVDDGFGMREGPAEAAARGGAGAPS